MAEKLPWYVRQRAESLAYVFLTNEQGIRVAEERGLDFGIDYRIDLALSSSSREEWVGVQLKAADADPPAAIHLDRRGLSEPYIAKLIVPVFLLVVNARDEKYFFSWIKEPTLGKRPRLKSHTEESAIHLSPFDRKAYHERLAECRRYFKAPKVKKQSDQE